jgi:hypothetical protein
MNHTKSSKTWNSEEVNLSCKLKFEKPAEKRLYPVYQKWSQKEFIKD